MQLFVARVGFIKTTVICLKECLAPVRLRLLAVLGLAQDSLPVKANLLDMVENKHVVITHLMTSAGLQHVMTSAIKILILNCIAMR